MRLFIGIPIPEDILERIAEASKELADPNLKIIPKENLHLTLAFLGEYDLDKANEKLGRMKFENGNVEMKGSGVFPKLDYARIVWIGTRCEEMKRNAEMIMKEFNINENRETTLHLTVARVYGKSDRIGLFLEKYKDKEFGSFNPEDICIYESILKKPNPEYKIIEKIKI
ncbi:MAG: RNA 2',3'-cyclic phosphodiesterase [Candidatus Micrarchaeota archaeon]|nr:RNA 2',3'-cyclic phosphodiesterase [Candidatus Micrarchaeota archaeon]